MGQFTQHFFCGTENTTYKNAQEVMLLTGHKQYKELTYQLDECFSEMLRQIDSFDTCLDSFAEEHKRIESHFNPEEQLNDIEQKYHSINSSLSHFLNDVKRIKDESLREKEDLVYLQIQVNEAILESKREKVRQDRLNQEKELLLQQQQIDTVDQQNEVLDESQFDDVQDIQELLKNTLQRLDETTKKFVQMFDH